MLTLKNIFAFGILSVFFMGFTAIEDGLFIIDVNSAKSKSLKLSEITENINAIELEMTDYSQIDWKIRKVLYTGDEIVICGQSTILLFDKTGKFIRQIGSFGQGFGEFSGIFAITVDIYKKNLYVYALEKKVICFDFNGEVIKEIPIPKIGEPKFFINYFNNRLLFITRFIEKTDEERIINSALMITDNNLTVTDILEINKSISRPAGYIVDDFFNDDFINYDGANVYLYNCHMVSETMLDTLYQLKDNQLIPYLKLKFNDDDYKKRNVVLDMKQSEKFLAEFNKLLKIKTIYKSSRYVFSLYSQHDLVDTYFCYDIKTGQGYKSNGYTDDIHTKEVVKIRPVSSDANKFYYLHQNKSENKKDVPNPTLYIGTLKK